MGIIPDKFILLDVADELTCERVLANLKSGDNPVTFQENQTEALALSACEEYKHHIEGVKETCRGFIHVVDGNKAQDVVLEEIARIHRLHTKNSAPKRAPRLLICGPPGSGRSSNSRRLAEKYELVHVQVSSLIKHEIAKKTPEGRLAWRAIKNGDPVDSQMVQRLISERLAKLDCKINGFILDGAPNDASQIDMIQALGIVPTAILALELNDHVVYERLEHRRFDPLQGKCA